MTRLILATVKRDILWGMIVLVPAMAAVGGSGFRLARGRHDEPVARKRKRMPIIALTGLLVLIPSAIFLDWLASAGTFDWRFFAVQSLELAAGAVNIALMSLNMRDGLRLTRGPSAALSPEP